MGEQPNPRNHLAGRSSWLRATSAAQSRTLWLRATKSFASCIEETS